MSGAFFSGVQWSAAEIVKMKAQADITKARMEINRMASTAPERLFMDVQDGFTFGQHGWNIIVRNGERERFMLDAIAHRDEALRRRVVCRMEGRVAEAKHWLAAQRFLENLFKLEPV